MIKLGCMAQGAGSWLTDIQFPAAHYPVYVPAVSGCIFSAMLLDMRAPKAPFSGPAQSNKSWPYHLINLTAIAKFNVAILCGARHEMAGQTYQCACCGKAWNSKSDSSKEKPKVRQLYHHKTTVPASPVS